MMTWIKTHRRSAIMVALTLAVPLYLFLATLGAMVSARAEYMEQVDAIEPRLSRMKGLIIKEDELRASLAGVSTVVQDHIYPNGTAAAAVAAATATAGAGGAVTAAVASVAAAAGASGGAGAAAVAARVAGAAVVR